MKRKTASKALSLLLTLCMVIGLFPAVTITASAAEVSTWADLQTAFNNGGEIQLTADVTAGATDKVLTVASGKTVTLDLAGHKIDRNLNVAKSVGNVINVEGTLTVNDSSEGQTGAITGGYSNTGVYAGAAVCVKTGGEFTLNSGNISENKAPGNGTFGAGVVVQDNATFIMNGGSVSKNQSGNLGGGVAAAAKATVKLLGGRIENNTAAKAFGGGVYFYGSNVTVGGSIVIKNNTASGKTNNVQSGGGPLLLSEDKPLTTDAEIGWTEAGTVFSSGKEVATGTDVAKYLNNFVSDSPSYIIGVKKNDSKTIWIAKSGSTTVTRPVKRSITITAGQHMTKTANSGAASQTDLSGAMTAVVYTAESGYYFPENYVSSISGLTNGALNGISVTRNSETQITVSGTPTAETKITLKDAVAVPAPIFDACNGSDPVKSETLPTTNPTWSGYDFAGWYTAQNGGGTAVTADSVTAGSTTSLDLTAISASNPLGATLTDGVYTNADEGWSWDAATKILTLSGCTIDVPGAADFAVCLPDGATLTTAADTKNTLSNVSTGSPEALLGEGAVTITGSGSLSLSGYQRGLSAGEITINAPITVIATKQGGMAVVGAEITINSALSITEPSGGQICEGKGCYIADSNGNAAAKVVIGAAAPTFTDGLGNADCAFTDYKKGETNDKGYTFAGWFNGESELTSADAAVAGTTYTAKWTKNGKTVRTSVLDLTKIAEENTFGATLTDGVYTNADEGWSWNPETKTLTLSGVTMDIPDRAQESQDDLAAVCLPDGAIITTAADTQNILSNSSTIEMGSSAVLGMGALTVTGSGSLSVSGTNAGFYAMGNIAINAPITATATTERGGMAVLAKGITIDSSLDITVPTGGIIMTDGMTGIADSEGHFAANVVIGVAAPTFTDGLGNADCAFTDYKKGETNDKGYTFAGWFNGESELTSADAAVAGTTYTAKWTKNGKTVRTTVLDLTKIAEENTFGATLTDGVYTNADEGWSWNPETKTLTLSGATMDIQISGSSHIGVHLPADATVATAENTENAVSVTKGSAFVGSGNLTIDGQGSLTVVGESSGICTGGNIAINAPIDVSITGDEIAAIFIESEAERKITIHEALDILTPAGGEIGFGGICITESDGQTPARSVVIGVAKKYNVTFNTNGGSAVEPVTVSENRKLTAPTAPTRKGYTFLGWYKDAAFTNAWNFAEDTVTGNTTLYAKWTEATKIYGISGTVYASDGATTASGVTVKLMKGDTQVASTTSATDGTYNFTGIAPGVYNIVANDGTTNKTELVMITDANREGVNITMPLANVSSALTVSGTATPDVVAGGLAEESAAVKAGNPGATSVKVEMTVESKSSAAVDTADKTNIETVAPGKTLEYLDIKVTKTVDGSSSAITTTANTMEIIIPYDMTGKRNITVYRNHSGSAAAFTQLSTLPGSGAADGTYYLDTANNLIYMYTKNFSTYAIGYTTGSGGSSSSGSSAGYSITLPGSSLSGGKLSVSPKSATKGTTVTITVSPDAGYELERLTVKDSSGKEIPVTSKGSGKYTFTMPGSKIAIEAAFRPAEQRGTYADCTKDDSCPVHSFTDTEATAWYHDGIHYCVDNGLMQGTGSSAFSPALSTSRAMIAAMLWRLEGSAAVEHALNFADVEDGAWYTESVRWAAKNGIMDGYGNGSFGPNDAMTREQMVAILYRYAQSKGYDVSVGEDTNILSFEDATTITEYAIPAMQWACGAGVVKGKTAADGSLLLDPKGSTTRAEMAAMMMRFCTDIVE